MSNLDQYFYQPGQEVAGSSVSYSYSSGGAVSGGAVSGGAVSGGLVSGGLVSGGLVSSGLVGDAGYVSSSYNAGDVVQVSSSSNQAVANQVVQDLLVSGGGSSRQVVGGSYGSSGALEASAFSAVEQAILSAANPINVNESEVITVNGQSGVWANRAEVVNWRGVIPITQYLINEDQNPEIVRKRVEQQLIYEQEIAIRYLRPPTPPPPGEIVIKQEKNILTPPAPPLVIRQQPPRPDTPPPLVIREAPPRPPAAVGQKVVLVSGKRLPPPPRKVIIERLAPLPSKPQSVIIERWLPYRDQKRRVIFQRQTEADPVIPRPRNVIVQWEAPAVVINKQFRDLGVIRANPVEYVSRYGATLKVANELPQFVREIKPPVGVVLASEYVAASLLELEGDVDALNLINLDSEGLSQYRSYLRSWGSSGSLGGSYGVVSSGSYSGNSGSLVAELFASVDRSADNRISLSEAESLLLKLNSRLGRSYGEAEVRAFFAALDSNRDGVVDLNEFRAAVVRSVA